MDMRKDVWPSLNVTGVDNSSTLLRNVEYSICYLVFYLVMVEKRDKHVQGKCKPRD